MKQRVYLLLAAALVLAACSKEELPAEITNNGLPREHEGAISFAVDATLTRGTLITDASDINSMGVFCGLNGGDYNYSWSSSKNVMENVRISRIGSTSTFTYNPLRYWTAAGANQKFSFFAYAPYSSNYPTPAMSDQIPFVFPNTGSSPVIRYRTSADVTTQPDLMIAEPILNRTDNPVAFKMHHVLAAIGFRVKNPRGEKINAIGIQKVRSHGYVSMADRKWSDLDYGMGQSWTFNAGTSGPSSARNDFTGVMNENGVLMMIPQTLEAGAKIIVTVDGQKREVDLGGVTWEAGKRYIYDLDIKPQGTIVGIFGGWDERKYTKLLQVEHEVSNAPSPWSSEENLRSSTASFEDGQKNTDRMKTNSKFLAAKYCADKGRGWYLPGRDQLMAVHIASRAVPEAYQFSTEVTRDNRKWTISYYWSSTESSLGRTWGVAIGSDDGNVYTENKKAANIHADENHRVRCVRDVELNEVAYNRRRTGAHNPGSQVRVGANGAIFDNRYLPTAATTDKGKPRGIGKGGSKNGALGDMREYESLASWATNETVSQYFEMENKDYTAAKLWEAAVSRCRYLTHSGSNAWRLPTQRELQLMWVMRHQLAAQGYGFTADDNALYWSGTKASDSGSWVVSFSNGRTENTSSDNRTRNATYVLRCVRDLTPP